jgi:hypothetical protein
VIKAKCSITQESIADKQFKYFKTQYNNIDEIQKNMVHAIMGLICIMNIMLNENKKHNMGNNVDVNLD